MSWILKFGVTISALVAGPLLDHVTQFDAKLGVQSPDTILWLRGLFAGIPVVALLLAAIQVRFFPLTQERMVMIREVLEARRGSI